jgi:formate--tetrahydrofolate ligase
MTEAETAAANNALGHPRLQPKTPVPSDIQVSKDIVKDVGLLPMDQLAQEYVRPTG